MLFYKQLDEQSTLGLLQQISTYAEQILLKNSSKLSYQLAYDQVYQLCRNEKQQQLLQRLCGTLVKVLPEVFSQLSLDSQNFLGQFSTLIQKTEKNLETIRNVCLYLDMNYCKRDLGVELKAKLNQIFLSQLFKRRQILQCTGRKIAQNHIKHCYEDINKAVAAIKQIDDLDEEYFLNHFVPNYLPVVAAHYTQQAEQQFALSTKQNSIETYINYATETLQKQTKFLNKYWAENKKCGPNKQFIIRELYQIIVTKYKEEFYLSHKAKLFSQLTLEILELYKYGPKSSDIEKHADWYNVQIKQKLQTFPRDNNTQFITNICQFYKEIMTLLESTYNKFDIHYRSRFAFEQWINSQRLQMPLRLNEYIKEFCLNKIEQKQIIVLQRINVVFVLMKEKNLFEKHYRRELINRILNNFGPYSIKGELKIVEMMEKECSEEFVKNVRPIIESYEWKKQISGNNGNHTFFLNLENWPYDEKNTTIIINEELLKIVQKQNQQFVQNNKDKSIYWHPIIGLVRLEMNFLQSNWKGQLILNTCMANLLLYFAKNAYQPFEVKTFCCETGYKLDQIYDSVKRLIHVKLLLNQGTEENYILAINQGFSHSEQVFDILNVEIGNRFEAKPLEQLKADRKFMVEAIIVKLMKKLKNTDKETILKQACPLIQKRGFNFNAKFVESAIERLIDKEFIRDYEDGKYGYIA